MNSKLRWLTRANKTTFSKKVNPVKNKVELYIYWWGPEIYYVFYWCILLDHEIYTKCKYIYSHKICSGIKSQPVKKKLCHSVPKTLDFSQNYSVPFHRVTFDHLISCVLLIDKANESCQNYKKFKRNAISTAK